MALEAVANALTVADDCTGQIAKSFPLYLVLPCTVQYGD